MLKKLAVLMAATGLQLGAFAAAYQGTLADPNDVASFQVELFSDTALQVQSWGYGGTGGAPGGRNEAGQVIAGGGFDAYLSLFAGWGDGAIFLSANDDGPCPPADAADGCRDPQLLLPTLAAGRYTVVLSQWNNYSFAENLGGGTLGDGFIGLAGDFGGRSAAWALDVSVRGTTTVPEPATAGLALLAGCAVLASRRVARRRETQLPD